MKKLIISMMMVLISTSIVLANEVVSRDEKQLPEMARSFIDSHFSDAKVSYVKIDRGFLSRKYEAVLTNGVEIDFDSRGEWTEIDSKREAIPNSVVPTYIKDYVEKNFNGNFITQIERERRGIVVELDNDLNLIFDNAGNLRKIDD